MLISDKEFNERLSQCFKTDYKRNISRIYHSVSRWDNALPEDVLQDAFCKAVIFKASFDPEKGSFENWFSRILYNTICDAMRAKHQQKEEDLGQYEQHFDINYITVLENRDLVKKLIKLDPDERSRKFLTLLFIKGYSVKDIQSKLGLTENVIWKIVARFKKFLKEKHNIGI